jgi:hypothetical protein
MNEPCGYCGGRGFILGSMYDAYGYQRFDEPPRVTCEYCGGFGQCEDGGLLLPAREPHAPDNPNAGLPSWA